MFVLTVCSGEWYSYIMSVNEFEFHVIHTIMIKSLIAQLKQIVVAAAFLLFRLYQQKSFCFVITMLSGSTNSE